MSISGIRVGEVVALGAADRCATEPSSRPGSRTRASFEIPTYAPLGATWRSVRKVTSRTKRNKPAKRYLVCWQRVAHVMIEMTLRLAVTGRQSVTRLACPTWSGTRTCFGRRVRAELRTLCACFSAPPAFRRALTLRDPHNKASALGSSMRVVGLSCAPTRLHPADAADLSYRRGTHRVRHATVGSRPTFRGGETIPLPYGLRICAPRRIGRVCDRSDAPLLVRFHPQRLARFPSRSRRSVRTANGSPLPPFRGACRWPVPLATCTLDGLAPDRAWRAGGKHGRERSVTAGQSVTSSADNGLWRRRNDFGNAFASPCGEPSRVEDSVCAPTTTREFVGCELRHKGSRGTSNPCAPGSLCAARRRLDSAEFSARQALVVRCRPARRFAVGRVASLKLMPGSFLRGTQRGS